MRSVRVIAAGRQNQIEDAARFVLGRAVFGAFDDRMHADPAIRPRRPGGGRFGIAHGAHFRHSPAAGKMLGKAH
jgi:hypothetical protein